MTTLSVMFVDVRGFTALSEQLGPADLVSRLNRFYDLAAEIVFDLDGTLDKMVGDQVMAFFGAHYRVKDLAWRAVQAALGIVGGVEKMAEGSASHFTLVAELVPVRRSWATWLREKRETLRSSAI